MFQLIERYAPDLFVKDDSGHTPAVLAGDNGHFYLRDYIEDQEAMVIARVTTSPHQFIHVYASMKKKKTKRHVRILSSFFDMSTRTAGFP